MTQWAFAQGKRVLFFPDAHLGRNTALNLGIPENEIMLWNQREEDGGLENALALLDDRVILWKGWCSVHLRFTVEQIKAARARFPGVRVVVHPECRHEVLAADMSGLTEYVIRAVHESPAGAIWAIGAEVHLVRRLAREHPDKTLFSLDPIVCPYPWMYRIHPAYLAWTLEEVLKGCVVNKVIVDDETAGWARIALERMLAT